MCEQEHLEMLSADRTLSPLHGSTPAPRVIQSQLDHLLEAEAVKIENDLLKVISKFVRPSGLRE